MEKPTGMLQKIIENLQQINALETYSPIEKDIILHNLRAAYMSFLNIKTDEQNVENRVEKLFEVSGEPALPSVSTDGTEEEEIIVEEIVEEEIINEEVLEMEEAPLVEEISPSNFEGVPEGRGSLYETINESDIEEEPIIEESVEDEIIEEVVDEEINDEKIVDEEVVEEEIIEEEPLSDEVPLVPESEPEPETETLSDEVPLVPEPETEIETLSDEVPLVPEPEPIIEETPVVTQPVVLQDDLLELIPDAKPKSNLLFDDMDFPKPEKKSLNDLLEKKEDNSLGAKYQQSFIPDLTKAFAINEKFAFIRELFQNSGVDFSNAIQKINECENIDAAFVLMEELKHQYFWDTTSSAYLSLCDLVRRRFI